MAASILAHTAKVIYVATLLIITQARTRSDAETAGTSLILSRCCIINAVRVHNSPNRV